MFFLSDACCHDKVVDVKTICAKTKNPSFCSKLLNSMPGGVSGADFNSIMKYTFDVMHGNVTNTIELINKLIAKGNLDVSTKFHLEFCLGSFISAKNDVEYTREFFYSKDYGSVGFALDDTTHLSKACLAFPPRYKDSSLLPKYVEVLEQVIQIIGVIFNSFCMIA
uniref:Pectinesterase inhibitor domain-containing protein n=1 Tax=Cajanus cajan TaxID=3821 RepID=A0A151S073_CAJCA|nr:hypothetical protein KK1_030109 [Cajanus cajan]